ncbi:MAG: DEAD/DEAH box helicase family protein [Parachlamydiales bacterium]|nr:DEAD/DEAH box helicase family protein [Parachlamydiales bacterium]
MKELLNILSPSKCWDDVHKQLIKIDNANHSAGKLFEWFCKYYYLADPLICRDYKHVWLFTEVPPEVKSKLNLGRSDHGIDLVLQDNSGQLSVVQCKFRHDQRTSICWSRDKLANLFADGDRADYFVVFTNASKLDNHSLNKRSDRLKLISISELLCLSEITIKRMRDLMLSNALGPEPVKQPRSYQNEAIQSVVDGFKNHDRGQLILPCGAGKTLTALWLKNRLQARRTLIVFPSLALLRQTRDEWSKNSLSYSPYMCVCSEKDINREPDGVRVHTYEISGRVSTDSVSIRHFLTSNDEVIIYSTYQSLEMISKAIEGLDFVFDLVICDEAHKTSGNMRSVFALVHNNAKIPASKRLYMTATPTILTNSVRGKLGLERLKYISDMTNFKTFGPEFYRMSFGDAINKDILVDYRIVAVGVNDIELSEAIESRRFVNQNESVDEIANNYALEHCMQQFKATHAVSFHSTVKNAKLFQERHGNLFPKTSSYHVSGELSTNDRKVLIKQFEYSSKAIITNARCLTEGVDVPSIDIVYFCDPKYSKIDIVQAVGRALRRKDHKQLGYIVVPIFHYEKTKVEEGIRNKAFDNLVNVVRALCSHDARLVAEITAIKLGKGKREARLECASIQGLSALITFEGFENKLVENLFVQLIDKISLPWLGFVEARSVVHKLKLKSVREWNLYMKSAHRLANVPSNPYSVYKKSGWQSWGDWLGTDNIAPRNMEFLSFEEARAFVHSLNFKSTADWRKYCKSGDKPKNIPSYPNETYEDSGWVSMSDWLGTKKTIVSKKFKKFEVARLIARSLGLKSAFEWKKLDLNKQIPEGIPKHPENTYKNKGWISWMDWLGTSNVDTKKIEFLDFEKARAFARSLNLKSLDEWCRYCKSGNKPANIPTGAYSFYKGKGWISWEDWLGIGFLSFNEAKKFVHSLGLKSLPEWMTYCKTKEKPLNIPRTPDRVYKGKWHSWGDWLGTDKPSKDAKSFLSFDKAREFIRSLNLESETQWRRYCKSGNKPFDIPSNPALFYRDIGWTSWPDWLGTRTIPPKNRVYLSFHEARKFVHNLKLKSESAWRRYCKSGNRPQNISAKPDRIYKDKGWVSWPDWLGTRTVPSKNRMYFREHLASKV